jgi:hypothetical protein
VVLTAGMVGFLALDEFRRIRAGRPPA